MKLFYSPGACSLSPHIVLRELGLDFELVRMNTKTHKTDDGQDFYQINPKGYVPALLLDSGDLLTEGAAIVQYLADTHAEAGLAPKPGTVERAKLQAHLNYIAAEVHKSFSPLFNPAASDEVKAYARNIVQSRFDFLEANVLGDGRQYLMGDTFSVADAYLFTVSNWAAPVGLDLGKWPKLAAYAGRIAQRPKVQEALKAEGLVKG